MLEVLPGIVESLRKISPVNLTVEEVMPVEGTVKEERKECIIPEVRIEEVRNSKISKEVKN